jgi:transcriptional regulator with XRE-family HTH domain
VVGGFDYLLAGRKKGIPQVAVGPEPRQERRENADERMNESIRMRKDLVDDASSFNSDIGGRLREIRRSRSMTLGQLSEESGVSIATISKLETGKIRSNFSTIYKLCRGLNILVNDILKDNMETRKKIETITVRNTEEECHPTDLYEYHVLASQLDGRLNSYVMGINTREVPDLVDWSNHPGEEVIYILKGEIDLYILGENTLHLGAGDSASFDCGKRHAFVCRGSAPARILSVSTRPRKKRRTAENSH